MADKSSLVKSLGASAVGRAASHFGQVAEHFMMKARSPRTRNLAYRIVEGRQESPKSLRPFSTQTQPFKPKPLTPGSAENGLSSTDHATERAMFPHSNIGRAGSGGKETARPFCQSVVVTNGKDVLRPRIQADLQFSTF